MCKPAVKKTTYIKKLYIYIYISRRIPHEFSIKKYYQKSQILMVSGLPRKRRKSTLSQTNAMFPVSFTKQEDQFHIIDVTKIATAIQARVHTTSLAKEALCHSVHCILSLMRQYQQNYSIWQSYWPLELCTLIYISRATLCLRIFKVAKNISAKTSPFSSRVIARACNFVM